MDFLSFCLFAGAALLVFVLVASVVLSVRGDRS